MTGESVASLFLRVNMPFQCVNLDVIGDPLGPFVRGSSSRSANPAVTQLSSPSVDILLESFVPGQFLL